MCDKSSQGKQLRFNDNWLPAWQQADALNPLTYCPILTPGGDREKRWHMTPSSQLKVLAGPGKQGGMMRSHRLVRRYSVCLVLLWAGPLSYKLFIGHDSIHQLGHAGVASSPFWSLETPPWAESSNCYCTILLHSSRAQLVAAQTQHLPSNQRLTDGFSNLLSTCVTSESSQTWSGQLWNNS